MNNSTIANQIMAHIRNGAQFVSVTYTSKNTGETARYTLNVGFSYKKMVEKSLLELELQQTECTDPLQAVAIAELIASMKNTLENMEKGLENDNYTKKGMYAVAGEGVRVFVDGTFELRGKQIARKVLVPGEYKVVNSRPKTLIKNKIRKSLPVGSYKSLALDLGNVHSVRLNGETIEID